MSKGFSFDCAASNYDETRPGYPKIIIDWIIDKTKVKPSETLLEIGPGTGQATRSFAERGYRVHAVESGANLAQHLINNLKGYPVTVDVSPFETWHSGDFKTTFVFCATAFHWIDPLVRYKKCHSLIKENGHLVLMWNTAIPLNYPQVETAYDLLFSYYPKEENKTNKGHDIHQSRAEDIKQSGLFKLVDYHEYDWSMPSSSEALKKGFFSQSSYLALSHDDKAHVTNEVNRLFDTLDKVFNVDFKTTAYIAKRL